MDPRPAEEVLTASSSSPEPAAASSASSPNERYTAYYHEACQIGCCYEDGDGSSYQDDDAAKCDSEDAGVVYEAPPETTTVTNPFGWKGEVVRPLPLSPTAEAELGLGPRQYRSTIDLY
nr:unnamed protein product [Digitaria exilis]CAB3504579.1 unnamed protein product [Digitaria exilis]